MFKVFAFGLETCIDMISPLMSDFINDALLDSSVTMLQSISASAHRRSALVSDKHIPA